MNRMLLVFLVSIFGIPSAAFAECEAMFSYTSGFGGDLMTIHVPEAGSTLGTVMFHPDVNNRKEFCKSDSAYFCFLPDFAVPKHFDGSIRKWTLEGKTFEVVRDTVAIQMLGRRIDGLYVIAGPLTGKKSERILYLFSPQKGLIGISYPHLIYWLADELGFGASESNPSAHPTRHRDEDLCPEK
jgi:hypothetical protein